MPVVSEQELRDRIVRVLGKDELREALEEARGRAPPRASIEQLRHEFEEALARRFPRYKVGASLLDTGAGMVHASGLLMEPEPQGAARELERVVDLAILQLLREKGPCDLERLTQNLRPRGFSARSITHALRRLRNIELVDVVRPLSTGARILTAAGWRHLQRALGETPT